MLLQEQMRITEQQREIAALREKLILACRALWAISSRTDDAGLLAKETLDKIDSNMEDPNG